MAKKKKGSGTRTMSRAEREARMQKPVEPFGLKKFLKERWASILVSALLMVILCAVANTFAPGDYVVPGIVAFVIAEGVQYYLAYRKEMKKTTGK